MDRLSVVLLSSLLALAAAQGIQAVTYDVTNKASGTPGGNRFESEIGAAYCKNILQTASLFILQTFEQAAAEADKKNVQHVIMNVDARDGALAYVSNDVISVSANYIADYKGSVRMDITGILYHEMAHVWQWDGSGKAPRELIEGIADFVRLKAGLAPSNWPKPGEGSKWDEGYAVTARFMDYCESLKKGFVAELNRKLKTDWSVNFFQELLGKTVDQLWNDYKSQNRT